MVLRIVILEKERRGEGVGGNDWKEGYEGEKRK